MRPNGGEVSWVRVDVGLVVILLILSGILVFPLQNIFKNVWGIFFPLFDIKILKN